MRLSTWLLSSFLYLCATVSLTVLAQEVAEEEASPVKVNLLIDDAAKRFIQMLKQQESMIIDSSFSIDNLKDVANNDAEQYLINFIEGALLFNEQKYNLVIEKLESTKALAKNLPESQVNSSTFRELHALLARSYIQINDYDHAFVEKKKYLTRKFDDNESINEKMNETLEKKFKIEQKNKAKILLEEQSRLKKLKIIEAQQQKSDNERDTAILICITIVFILLMLRQLNIRRKLLWLAQIDSLTSLKNRASLFEDGFVMFEQAKQGQQSLSIIYLDIDHFKNVNDQYGHDTGDKALIQVAQLGLEVMRSRDVFARIGGEEFIALLPGATLDDAKSIAVRLKDKIAQAEFHIAVSPSTNQQTERRSFNLTASIGLVQYQQEITDFDQLIQRADDAMYLAKSKGRNQVVTANELCESYLNKSIDK
ncbi:GGDEF domain-containing protein [Thalassotalea atypica]|uniref:GGDEF domain-containing protein n=1 Tax=Thalassotalea atypica TaxID=2054316 RepID=UPI002573F54E|nr:GGDEF domain-containing protein [Thalassotalea atypica]